MTSSRKVIFAVIGIALLCSSALFAQAPRDVPLKNWTVPTFELKAHGSQSGIRPLTHGQSNTPTVFVPFTPCRVFDSRVSSGGPGPIGGAGFGAERPHDVVTNLCGAGTVSDPIQAVSLNVTVLNTFGPGFVYFYPTGGTPPPVVTMNYTGAAGELRNNAAIVTVNAAGSFTIGSGVNGTDYVLDVNGVFLATLEPNTTFQIISETAADAIRGTNTYSSVGGVGVRGESINYNGVWAQSTNQDGLAAFGGRDGGYLQGARVGVIGRSTGTASNSAGVFGTTGTVSPTLAYGPSGVRGDAGSNAIGVFGRSEDIGVLGHFVNSAGTPQAIGILGVGGLDSINCGGFAEPVCPPDWGVWANGNIGATATKYFVDPHPTDPEKVIGYISLEGPEAGTYFRGRARFENGIARIAVPEHFRMVTDPEGLTVQITPIGGMATVGVLRVDLNEIVVQSSRNLEFSYLVQGVRSTFKEARVVWQGNEFRPGSAEESAPAWLSPGQRARLIANGTYKGDGTVNMETATRLGWDKVWEKRNPPAPAPNPE